MAPSAVRAALILATVALGAGCAARGGTGDPAAGPELAGHSYRSTDVRGRTLVAGTGVTLTFAEGRLVASAGCNTMSGAASWDDGTLTVDGGGLAITEIGCAPELHAQDEWLSELLGARPAVALADSTLTVGDEQAGLTLEEPADLPLQATAWTLDGLITGETVSSLPAGVDAQLVIDQDGGLTVSAGCPLAVAQVTVVPAADPTSGSLTIDEVGVLDVDCLAPVTAEWVAVQVHVLEVLAGTVDYRIEAEQLTLTNGNLGLMFQSR